MTFRSLLRVLGLMLALLAPVFGAIAQPVGIGYIDPDIIIVQMPEYAEMRDSLQARQQVIAGQLQAREDVIRTKFEELQRFAQSAVASAEAQQQRENEILGLQRDLEQAEGQGRNELAQREARMLEPLLQRLQNAIDLVSGRLNLTMVFAARANNAPVILFASDAAVNITGEVMTELGLEIPDDTSGN